MNKFLSIFLNSYEKIALKNISWRLAIINKIYNSLFKLNRDGKYMTHYTSNCYGTKNVVIDGNPATILTSLAVSAGCYINIDDGYTLTIGEQTIWAPNICMRTGNHDLLDRNKHICESIKIGKNCWIGFGAVILPGTIMGDNVTVGANSVVRGTFPSNVVIAGVPAKIIKEI